MNKFIALLAFTFPYVLNAQDCVDSTLIDPEMICTMIYDPVCGCNGITYSNSCVATYQGGVTSYTPGECGSVQCQDLAGVDFGLCDMALGIAFINGSCVSVSGCGWVVDEVDYSPFFFQNMEDCEVSCGVGGGDSCINQWQIEQGFTVDCLGIYDPVCGCDGVTYANGCEAYFYGGVVTYGLGSCDSLPDPENCQVIPMYVDFGECEMPLGYVRREGTMCEFISGCDYIGNNGYDYSEFFFESSYACNSFCLGSIVIECIDSTLIDLMVMCPAIYDPVCGCDSVTYGNACEALNHHGVTSFTPGECPTSGIGNISFGNMIVYPNPAENELWVEVASGAGKVVIHDLSGKWIYSSPVVSGAKNRLDIRAIEPGMYILSYLQSDGTVLSKRLVIEK